MSNINTPYQHPWLTRLINTPLTVPPPPPLLLLNLSDLKQLRAHITKEFRDQFETGLVHYLTGDWGYARDELERANEMMRDKVIPIRVSSYWSRLSTTTTPPLTPRSLLPPSWQVPVLGGDGPSLALLKYMDQYGYVAPASWSNYRPLTSK